MRRDIRAGKGMCVRIGPIRGCVVVLCLLVISVVASGCGAGLGETSAEATRRRQRAIRVNLSQMVTDIDRFLMLDEPSRLTERDLP